MNGALMTVDALFHVPVSQQQQHACRKANVLSGSTQKLLIHVQVAKRDFSYSS